MVLEAAYDEMHVGRKPNRNPIPTDRWPRIRREACVYFAPGGRRVLDVGCGSGVVLYNLRDRYELLCGVELSSVRAETCRGTLDGLNARVECGNVETGLPFEDGHFDTIIFSDVIEHVVDVWGAMAELRRLLEPGGTLVLTTPNIAELRRRLTLLMGRFPSTSAGDEGFAIATPNTPLDGGHMHYFNYSMLEKLFRKYEFSRTRRFGIGRLGRLHDLVPTLLSSACVVVANK